MRGWGRVLLPALLVLHCALAQHAVKLQQRVRSPEESNMLLEMLEYKEGTDRDLEMERPVIKLDSTFFGEIGVGSPEPQNFKVVFDTGSSVIWIYDSECTSCDSKEVVKHKFDPHRSKTYSKRDTPFSIRYGTGESRGAIGADKIKLADLEVQDQAFGRCNQPDEVMRSFPFDGIVGLSRALVRDPNVMPTIIKTIKDEHLLESKKLANTFAFYIGREENEESYLILGGSHHMLEQEAKNTEHAKGVHWVPTLNKNIYWELPLDEVYIHPRKPAASAPSEPATHGLEEDAIDPSAEDSYAAMQLDPETALLEVEATLETMEGRSAKRQHHAPSHHSSKSSKAPIRHKATHHVMEEDVDAESPFHEYGLERMNVKAHAFKPSSKKSTPQAKQAPAASKIQHKTVDTPSKSQHIDPTASKATPEAGKSELGTGQLLSSMHSKPGNSLGACTQDAEHMCIVSVDSGHSLMSGPPDMIREIKKQLTPSDPAASCTDKVLGEMPDISFAMGGKLFTLTAQDYMIELQGKCVPAFSERTVRNGHDWVLGEHFMRTFYTVFDYDNMRVGFSHLDHVTPHLDKIMKGSENEA